MEQQQFLEDTGRVRGKSGGNDVKAQRFINLKRSAMRQVNVWRIRCRSRGGRRVVGLYPFRLQFPVVRRLLGLCRLERGGGLGSQT